MTAEGTGVVDPGASLARPGEPSLLALIALFLAPGAAGTIVYLALAGPIQAAGAPAIDALLIAIVAVILPVEIAILLVARARLRPAGEAVIPYREPMRPVTWLWLVPTLIVAAFIGSALFLLVDAVLASQLFSWAPDWYLRPVDVAVVGRYSRTVWIVSLGAYLVVNVVAGPVVEELYFRGLLLPRMERFGRWAPLLNASLFSLYHLWSPWQLMSRIASAAPFVYAVRWRRNVYLGMVVHAALNAISGVILVVSVAQRL
ncbi:MAG TPA: CPBP family intramembrane glutamic endopeptidase [Candidatus Dormibacteraeota bacterium]|jgi:hypothetical protein